LKTQLERAFDFAPKRLTLARERIVEGHPSVADILAQVSLGDDDLRARVAEAAESVPSLKSLAFALNARELGQVARSVGAWEDLREAVAIIIGVRPKEIYVELLWRAWEAYPSADEIYHLLTAMAQMFGSAHWGSSEIAGFTGQWIKEAHPLPTIVLWLDERRLDAEDLPKVTGSPFNADTPLIRRLFETVLCTGSPRQLLGITPERILVAWIKMQPEVGMAAAQHYLGVLEPDVWSEELLLDIRESYGMPGTKKSTARFWNAVADADQRAFRAHFIAEDLAGAFRGDTDRHSYWKRWGDSGHILEIQRGHAGPTEWALLGFGDFSVLEFFESGNAAFFLAESDVRKIDWKAHHAGDMKRRMPNSVTGVGDNRLIHHHQRWRPQADQMMEQWLAAYGS